MLFHIKNIVLFNLPNLHSAASIAEFLPRAHSACFIDAHFQIAAATLLFQIAHICESIPVIKHFLPVWPWHHYSISLFQLHRTLRAVEHRSIFAELFPFRHISLSNFQFLSSNFLYLHSKCQFARCIVLFSWITFARNDDIALDLLFLAAIDLFTPAYS